jgi:ATP synthase protein I
MTYSDSNEKLRKKLKLQSMRMEKAKKERDTILSQTVYIGTLGLLFILPVIVGVYAGLWLDEKSAEYSSFWTMTLLIAGLVIGVLNVYIFIRNQS